MLVFLQYTVLVEHQHPLPEALVVDAFSSEARLIFLQPLIELVLKLGGEPRRIFRQLHFLPHARVHVSFQFTLIEADEPVQLLVLLLHFMQVGVDQILHLMGLCREDFLSSHDA